MMIDDHIIPWAEKAAISYAYTQNLAAFLSQGMIYEQ